MVKSPKLINPDTQANPTRINEAVFLNSIGKQLADDKRIKLNKDEINISW